MDLRQLEYFVAVAEEQNFTRAAARVHISQSGVSAQVRQLERELGATLLDRSGRTATLTASGAAALPPARAALAAADAVRQAVDEVNGLVRGRLTVGMVTACTVTPLFDALASFRADHGGVELTLLEDTSDRLVDRLRTGGADLALIGAAGAAPADLEALTVISEPLVAAVPPGHPLADRPWLRLADLAGHPLVCLPQGTGIRTVFDQACAARAVRPHVTLQAGAPSAVADLAARGLGVAVLSESMAASVKERLVAVPLQDVDQPAVLALVWRPTADPALRELVRHCRRAFGPATPASGGQPA
jgi:DNA-binding transcriptional LysR family regulator